MNKTVFEAPITEIIDIEATDILTASTDPFDGEWVPIGGRSLETTDSTLNPSHRQER